jgi:hypothetical protein
MVGLHHRVNRRLGIWFRPERCAFVSFLNFIESSAAPKKKSKFYRFPGKEKNAVFDVPSKPDAFSQNSYELLVNVQGGAGEKEKKTKKTETVSKLFPTQEKSSTHSFPRRESGSFEQRMFKDTRWRRGVTQSQRT